MLRTLFALVIVGFASGAGVLPLCRFSNAPVLQPAPKVDDPVVEKQLLVFTPADYMPFAEACRPGASSDPSQIAAEGSDIDLVQRFATANGYTLKLVRSTWKDVITDSLTYKFNLALGGITATDARKQLVDFASVIKPGGKVTVSRADNPLTKVIQDLEPEKVVPMLAAMLDNLTVTVNPGGTNEAAINRLFPNATTILVKVNGDQYGVLLDRKADITVTDQVEGQLFVLRKPELWTSEVVIPESNAFAWPVPKNESEWLQTVNTFLDAALADGTVEDVMKDWMEYFGTPDAAVPTAAPAVPTAAPAVPTAAPAVPTAAPANPTAAPANPTAAPAESPASVVAVGLPALAVTLLAAMML